MSLINDALKRARDAQPKNPPPSGAPPLQPVEPPARSGALWWLLVAAVLLLGAAGVILGPALRGRKSTPVLTAKTTEIPAPAPAAIAPASATKSIPTSSAAVTPVVTNTNPTPVAVENPPAAKTNAPAVAAPAENWPKVQGIVFNAARPLAVVNSRPVTVGDRVGDFQVKQITQTTVVFQRADGAQKTLGIGD